VDEGGNGVAVVEMLMWHDDVEQTGLQHSATMTGGHEPTHFQPHHEHERGATLVQHDMTSKQHEEQQMSWRRCCWYVCCC
jgi:hypothetical protein